MTLESVVLGMPAWWWLQHLAPGIFVFCLGACVGSFLNVVIYRLPAGMSVTTPPSRCSVCGARLTFFRENLPIIGWFLVRGKCRHCGVPVSPQYMLVETLMAVLFLGLYAMLYMSKQSAPWFGELGGPWWTANGIVFSWPAFIAYAFMIAGLLAMTVIDARTFTIPMQIPLFVTFTAFLAFPLQALLARKFPLVQEWCVPLVGWPGLLASVGGAAGALISWIRLRTGRVKPSFADYADYLPRQADDSAAGWADGGVSPSELIFLLPAMVGLIVGAIAPWWAAVGAAVVTAVVGTLLGGKGAGMTGGPAAPSGEDVLAADYPHARREMLVEIRFLLPCMIGVVAGWLIGLAIHAGPPPLLLRALGASFAGYLMGGGLVWAIRILGSLAFGKEAMGLGDVHLLAAVGAVLGWFDPILIFFIAPFSGLLWAFGSIGLASLFRNARRELPYGPHLALATLVMILYRPGIHSVWTKYMPGVPWPNPAYVPPPLPPRGVMPGRPLHSPSKGSGSSATSKPSGKAGLSAGSKPASSEPSTSLDSPAAQP